METGTEESTQADLLPGPSPAAVPEEGEPANVRVRVNPILRDGADLEVGDHDGIDHRESLTNTVKDVGLVVLVTSGERMGDVDVGLELTQNHDDSCDVVMEQGCPHL